MMPRLNRETELAIEECEAMLVSGDFKRFACAEDMLRDIFSVTVPENTCSTGSNVPYHDSAEQVEKYVSAF